jgi:hypothetical protein
MVCAPSGLVASAVIPFDRTVVVRGVFAALVLARTDLARTVLLARTVFAPTVLAPAVVAPTVFAPEVFAPPRRGAFFAAGRGGVDDAERDDVVLVRFRAGDFFAAIGRLLPKGGLALRYGAISTGANAITSQRIRECPHTSELHDVTLIGVRGYLLK